MRRKTVIVTLQEKKYIKGKDNSIYKPFTLGNKLRTFKKILNLKCCDKTNGHQKKSFLNC